MLTVIVEAYGIVIELSAWIIKQGSSQMVFIILHEKSVSPKFAVIRMSRPQQIPVQLVAKFLFL